MAPKKYVIAGNGVAGVTAAFTLRARDPQAQITIVSGEGPFFFSRTALMYALMGHMELPQLEPYERSVWKRERIELVQDWITGLDANGGRLATRSGRLIAFDRLLLATGSQPKRPSWEGLHQVQSGLVNFVTRQDLERCEQLLPKTRSALVVGGGLIGVELVECLAHHRIPVRFLVREPHFFPAALSAAEAAIVERHLRARGVDLRTGVEVTSVLADGHGQVSGVESQGGEVHAGDFLGVAIGVTPAVDWLRQVETPPALGRGVRVDAGFATSLPGVYAAGDCAEIGPAGFVEQLWYSAKRQGELAARAMLGDTVNYTRPTFYNSSKFFEIEFTCVGASHADAAGREYFGALPDRPVSVRLIEREGLFAGISLLGSRWRHEYFERWIAERRTVAWVGDHLPEAQFDVEFGRIPLEAIRRQIQGQVAA
ncbi:MAG: NAD(P)/FAD-dependent oxidoreductase [Bryobacteraceae bacterium]|nr:NAD(P)/FAD-dependent oxidoreductase [Bryobacteraceae bacterium]